MRWLRFFLGIFTVIFISPPAEGKCPFAEYEISGTVEVPDGIDVEDLEIYLFVGDARNTSDYPLEQGEVEFSTPAPNGYFAVKSQLNTLSGASRWRGDRCRGFATEGELFIIGKGIRALRVRFSLADRRTQGTLRKELAVLKDLGVVLVQRKNDSF